MKLNISAKELLALHNLLHKNREGLDEESTLVRQLYGRVKACLIGALGQTDKYTEPFEAWEEVQKKKIDVLQERLEGLKPEAVAAKVRDDLDKVESYDELLEEDETILPEYPRRRQSGQPHQKKKR